MNKKKRLLCIILSLVMVITLLPVQVVKASSETKTVRLSILTDVHLFADYPDENDEERAFYDYVEGSEMRMIRESEAILDAALSKVYEYSPDAVLVCGDLSSGGEYFNHKAFADKMTAAKTNLPEETGIFVIPGNHDINNSSGIDYNGTDFERAKRVTAEDFRSIYDSLGYSSAYSFFEATPGLEVENYGGLSYAVDIADGITLIALDTVKYSNDTDAVFDKSHLVSGEISDELLNWAVEEAKKANARGNLVLGMSHHGIIPHYDIENELAASLSKNYVIENWENAAVALADAGIAAFFTGHDHDNDISKFVSPNGNTIYDIETAALCSYPCSFRTVDITIEKKDTETSYRFDINTDFVEALEGIEDFQAYAFDKCSFNIEYIDGVIMNLLRPYIHEMNVFSSDEYGDGPEGYIRKELKVSDEISIDSYFDEQLVKLEDLLKEKLPFSTEFSFGNVYTIDISYHGREDRVIYLDICLSHEEEVKPDTPASGSAISLSETDITKKRVEEKGIITIDLNNVPAAILNFKNKLSEIIGDADNLTTDYSNTVIMDEASKLIKETVKYFNGYKIDPENEDSTLFKYINRIYMGLRHGDEESVSEEVKNEYKNLIEKIKSDSKLKKDILDRAVNSISDNFAYNADEYPELFSILRSIRFAPEYESFINLVPEESSSLTLMLFNALLFNGLDNGENLLLRLIQIYQLNLPIPETILDDPLNKVTDLIKALISDTNVPEDMKFSFNYIQKIAKEPEPITPVYYETISSTPVPTAAVIKKNTPSTPAAPELLKKDSTSIEVKTVTGQAYSLDGFLWSINGKFDGLEPDKEYSIFTRVAATSESYASEISDALLVTTDKANDAKDKTDIVAGSKISKSEKSAAKIDINAGFIADAGKSKITVEWGAVEGAERYDIYAAYCKKGSKVKKIASVDGDTLTYAITKLDGKAIDTEINIKVYIAAYRKVGESYKRITRSLIGHIAGYNNKEYTNVKNISVNKNSVELKTGDSFRIEAEAVLNSDSKKMLDHAAEFRFAASAPKVAAVDEAGLITANKKGTCIVYVYAQNGYAKAIKVTVK